MAKSVAPDRCPICSGELHVMTLKCEQCNIKIQGDFAFPFPSFSNLSAEDLRFLEVFIKNAGSLKDVQAELSLSYPTVKKQLDRIITAMGYSTPEGESKSADAADVLDRLKRGELTAQDAINQLKQN